MKLSSALFGLGLLASGFLAAARTSDGATSPAPSPAPPLIGNAVTGKETFTQYCSVCHGVGAKGFIGPKIAGINWTTPGLHAIVRGGVGGYGSMPAFNADAVSDQNIADIAAYLAPPSPRSTPQPATSASTTPVSAAAPSMPASAPTGTAAPTLPPADVRSL